MTRDFTVRFNGFLARLSGASLRTAVPAAARVLALAFTLMLAAGSASAQTTVRLVSNMEQSSNGINSIGPVSSNVWRQGQVFTTGDHEDGYTLSGVEVRVGSSANNTIRASIWTVSAQSLPADGGKLYDLTTPASITPNAVHTLSAPPGARLNAGTRYVVVFEATQHMQIRLGDGGNLDPGAASGWSLDSNRLRRRNMETWSPSPDALQIAIRGAPVTPEAQKRVLKRTLAAVASRTVSSAVDTLGARMGEAVPAAGLSLAGLNLAGPNPAGPENAAMSGRQDTDGFDSHGPSGGGHGRGMTAGKLLGSGAFSYTLGAAPGDKNADPMAPRWGIWGRGDFGTFAGRSSDGSDGGSRYDGDLRTGWLGADARGTRGTGRWVAGLAVSRGTSETNYTLDGEPGRIETDLTAFWPYGRWTFPDGLEIRGLLGVGRGEARHRTGDGEPEKSDLSMWAASAGFGRPLPPLGGLDLSARGDASLAFMETASGDGAVDGLEASVSRVRGGVEASKRIAVADGALLTPFAELAGRMDGGDGVTGPGMEVAGGLRYAGPRVAVELRGRWLAVHSEAGAKERGASLTARMQPGALGRGLSMSLAPRWGAGTSGTSALWREELPRGGSGDSAGGFEGELGYGFGLNGGRLTGTPNVGFGQSDNTRDYRIGWRLTPARSDNSGFEVSLDATRRESADANEPPAHGAMLTGAIRW